MFTWFPLLLDFCLFRAIISDQMQIEESSSETQEWKG